MHPISRGIRNAFRNGVRTSSIVIILGLSIGLSLTMLIAQKAVDNKVKSVKASIGNTISVAPAGFTPGSQANNALTTAQLAKVQSLPHVTGVNEMLNDRLPTTGTSMPMRGFGRDSEATTPSSTTSLTSPVTLNANGGRRFISGGNSGSDSSPGSMGSTANTFSLPVSFIGTNDTSKVSGTAATISSGNNISGSADKNDALVSKAMADKNNLKAGSTFSAYNATLKVAGIFTSDNQGANNAVVLSLPALQRLSGQGDTVTSATVTVDALDNLSAATASVKSQLDSSADVTSAQDQADSTVKPLNSVKTVSQFSLIGAVVAGAVIILLTMVMVVRERKKEIGVVKAIGGSNLRIISEFMVESLTLAVLGAVVGLLIGVVGGQPVTKALVDNSIASTNSATVSAQSPGSRGFGGRFGQNVRNNTTVRNLNNVKAQVGPTILLEGFAAAILIAVLGSVLAAGMISRVRPSTIMRSE